MEKLNRYLDLLTLEASLVHKGYKESTVSVYKRMVKHFLEDINKETLSISRQDVIQYLNKQLEINSRNTILVKLNALEFFFEEVLGLDITRNIKEFKRELKVKDLLSAKDVEQIIALALPREQMIYKLIYETGMVSSEILELRDTDLKNIGGDFYIGEFKVSKELAREYLNYSEMVLKHIEGDNRKIIRDRYNNDLGIATLRNMFRKHVYSVLGIELSLSDLRKSAALEMMKKGNVEEAQIYLRHKNKSQTVRYYKRYGIYIGNKRG